MNKERYVLVSIFGLTPPLTWVLHFAFIYLTQQFLCNHYGTDVSAGSAHVKNIILVFSVLVVIALTIFMVRSPTILQKIIDFGDKSVHYSETTVTFLNHITMLLAGLSGIAIIWSTLSVIFLNSCSAPF